MNTIAINLPLNSVPVKEVKSETILERLSKVSDKVKMRMLQASQVGGVLAAMGLTYGTWSTGVVGTSSQLPMAASALGLWGLCAVVDFTRKRLKNKMQRDAANANPDKIIADEIRTSQRAIEMCEKDKKMENRKAAIAHHKERLDIATSARDVLSKPEEKRIAARLLQKSEGSIFNAFIGPLVSTSGALWAATSLSLGMPDGPAKNAVLGCTCALVLGHVASGIKHNVMPGRYFDKLKKMVGFKQKEK